MLLGGKNSNEEYGCRVHLPRGAERINIVVVVPRSTGPPS